MRHFPPRRRYFPYRLKCIMTPHPDVSFLDALCFANLFFTPVFYYFLLALRHSSIYIYWTVMLLIYVNLWIVGTIVLSHSRLMRKHKIILYLIQFVNLITCYFFRLNLVYIIIGLFEMFKDVLHF